MGLVLFDIHPSRSCTAIFKMDNQQGPTIQHMELSSKFCASLDWGGLGESEYMYVQG